MAGKVDGPGTAEACAVRVRAGSSRARVTNPKVGWPSVGNHEHVPPTPAGVPIPHSPHIPNTHNFEHMCAMRTIIHQISMARGFGTPGHSDRERHVSARRTGVCELTGPLGSSIDNRSTQVFWEEHGSTTVS